MALARALVTEPEILLLDEPLSALDAHLVVRMQAELIRLHRELGITFFYVTHNQSEAFAMANRVVIMNNGRIEQVGPAERCTAARRRASSPSSSEPTTSCAARSMGSRTAAPGCRRRSGC